MPKKSNKPDKKKKKSSSKKTLTPEGKVHGKHNNNKSLKKKSKEVGGHCPAGDERQTDIANNFAAIELIVRMIEAIEPAAIDAKTKERLHEVYELVAKAQKASLKEAGSKKEVPASPPPKSPPKIVDGGKGHDAKGGDGAKGGSLPAKEAAKSPPPGKEASKSGGKAAKEPAKSKDDHPPPK